MNVLQNQLFIALSNLEKQGLVTIDLVERVVQRLEEGKLTQSENPHDHMCAFFVPFHPETKRIFLGHHIKADMWIPPGGHIEQGELLEDTVRREFGEELGISLGDETVELFAATVVDLEPKPGKRCQRHWDWWHMVKTHELIDYDYDRGEFYEAGWFNFEEALTQMKTASPVFVEAIEKLEKIE